MCLPRGDSGQNTEQATAAASEVVWLEWESETRVLKLDAGRLAYFFVDFTDTRHLFTPMLSHTPVVRKRLLGRLPIHSGEDLGEAEGGGGVGRGAAAVVPAAEG